MGCGVDTDPAGIARPADDPSSTTATAVLTDNAVVRGDGGARGQQTSGVLIDDSDNVSGVAALTVAGLLTNSAGVVRHHVHADVNAADYTVLATDDVIFATDSAGGANNVVLEDAPTDSRVILIHNEGAVRNVAVTTAGSDTISGHTTLSIQPGGWVTLFYDSSATDWHGVGEYYLGEIKVVTGSTTQITNGTGNTYDLITGFNTAAGSDAFGLNMTPAKASNKITTIFAGLYKATFSASITGSESDDYSVQLFQDGNATGIICIRTIGTGQGSEKGNFGFSNRPVVIAAGKDVDVRVACTSASKNFIPLHMSLTLEKV